MCQNGSDSSPVYGAWLVDRSFRALTLLSLFTVLLESGLGCPKLSDFAVQAGQGVHQQTRFFLVVQFVRLAQRRMLATCCGPEQ